MRRGEVELNVPSPHQAIGHRTHWEGYTILEHTAFHCRYYMYKWILSCRLAGTRPSSFLHSDWRRNMVCDGLYHGNSFCKENGRKFIPVIIWFQFTGCDGWTGKILLHVRRCSFKLTTNPTMPWFSAIYDRVDLQSQFKHQLISFFSFPTRNEELQWSCGYRKCSETQITNVIYKPVQARKDQTIK